MSKYPSQTQDKFTVRFPDGMRDEIAKRAEKNGRSMNSEIIDMLKFVMAVRPIWVDNDELYLAENSGFGDGYRQEVSSHRYPDKDPGFLFTALKEKIDEINEILENSKNNQDTPDKK